jgi:hypothetical protein
MQLFLPTVAYRYNLAVEVEPRIRLFSFHKNIVFAEEPTVHARNNHAS